MSPSTPRKYVQAQTALRWPGRDTDIWLKKDIYLIIHDKVYNTSSMPSSRFSSYLTAR